MKKFWIFLLGIIVAVIGFHFFANKSEPTPDNPPSNIEQPGDENQQPGDNNETPTPDNPGDVGSETQYTTNRFNLNNVQLLGLDKYNPQTGECISVDFSNGLDSVQLEIGSDYMFNLLPASGYTITELIYDSSCFWSGYVTDSFSGTFTAVENGVFSVTTQAIQTEQTGYSVNNLVECDAAEWTAVFRDLNGNQVDTLYAGQDYTFEISIHETDRIVVYLQSNFFSPTYPNTQTAGSTFNMLYDVDPNSAAIWVYTALTTEAVNLVMGDITGVSVNITTIEALTPESYYPNLLYQVEIIADADYNVLGFSVGENVTTFEDDPIYGGTSRYYSFTIPADATGNVEFSVTTEYVGAE